MTITRTPAEAASVGFKYCTKCLFWFPISNFWKQSKAKDGLNTWCKGCITAGMKEAARKRKRAAIAVMGGCCSMCGGVFHQAVYDFHHKDPKEKESGIAQLLQSYSVEHPKMKEELEKCVLLCSNCHRTLHATEEENSGL